MAKVDRQKAFITWLKYESPCYLNTDKIERSTEFIQRNFNIKVTAGTATRYFRKLRDQLGIEEVEENREGQRFACKTWLVPDLSKEQTELML